MPDWTGSFHRPHMTTEKFMKMKADYIAKNGYTITVPGLSDIIKIPIEKPMTENEVKAWKRRDYKSFSPERYEEIKRMKQKRRDKFLAMLASPTPHIVNNVGSIMTSIDDAQDCLATLAWIGMLAIKTAPRIMGKFIAGPVGWMVAASEMLNTLQRFGLNKIPALETQTAMWKGQHASTTSRKARVKTTAKTMKWAPSKYRLIEAAQVTRDIFGYGLCLGPLVGFAIQSVTGPYRRITGAKVNVKVPWPDLHHWGKIARRYKHSVPAYIASGLQTDDEEVMLITIANYLSQQELLVSTQNWNALDNVENIDEIEKLAPVPQNPLTLEVIEEEGIPLKDLIGWPHSSKPWAMMTDIMNELEQPCNQFQDDFIELHKNDWWSYAFGALNNEATCYTFTTAEGEGQVEYSYTASAVVIQVLTNVHLYPDPATPPEKMQAFADKIDIWEAMEIKPDIRLIMDFCKSAGIALLPF